MLLLNTLLGTTLQQPPFFSTATLQDGQLIRKTRLAVRLSQTELAREVGISQQRLAMMENGQRRISEQLAHRLWAAMWRQHEEQKKTPVGFVMLVKV